MFNAADLGPEIQVATDFCSFYYSNEHRLHSLYCSQATVVILSVCGQALHVPWHPAVSGDLTCVEQGRVDKEACVNKGTSYFCASAGNAPHSLTDKQIVTSINGAVLPSQKHGVYRAGRGGCRCSPTKARLEVCAQAGCLVTVRGQHHHGPFHLCCCQPDYELREESPRAKITTKRKLAATVKKAMMSKGAG